MVKSETDNGKPPTMVSNSKLKSKFVPAVIKQVAAKVDLEPDSVQDVYPCTSLQASLLAASLHGVGDYVSTFVFEISSTSCSPQDVRNACEILYDRTPILRTRFLESKGTFLQAVTRTSLTWMEHDSLETYLEQDHDKEVQLGQALARFAWISDVDGKTYLVWSLHHALYDEWSIGLLFEDLSLLASSSTQPKCSETRPNFSRFIKALSLVDQSASRTFWQRSLADFGRYRSFLPTVIDAFETSCQANLTHDLDVSQSNHQLSTLAIAAWSIFIAKLSGSETVAFGNIVNGRTAHIPGIVDICGPTMTTVPYIVNVPWEETVGSFLDKLEQIRNDMLPFEQTGLDEYRHATGAGRFDTLLSIRSSQTDASVVGDHEQLRPNTVMGRQIRHPCCLYLDVVFEPQKCTLKASFDARYVDEDHISSALEQLSICVGHLTKSSDAKLKTFADSVQIPEIVRSHHDDRLSESSNDMKFAIDAKILKQVQRAAQKVSPVHDIGEVSPDTSLRELGLDSLNTVVLARRLSEMFKVSVPFKEVTGLRKTVRDIAGSIQRIVHGSDEGQPKKLALFDLAEQHIKDFRFAEPLPQMETKSTSVLLTGATGYVGIGILRRLLISTDDTIVLLVRCKSLEQGFDRIKQTAEMARWKEDEVALLDHRIQIWPSDLGAANLGLDAQRLEDFKNIRTIIHNGARVDFSLDYQDLEATNVSATAFLLAHHLNSVSVPSFVYLTGGRSCPLDLGESLETTASKLAASNGYAQSKFAGEILVHRFRDLCRDHGREARMTIVHPGILIGSETTGVANTDDFVWRYVAASIQMRAYVPAVPTKREWVNLMTVDSVAAETVSAALERKSIDQVECRLMRSGLPVARFWEIVTEALGSEHVLEPVSEWEWLQRLEDALGEKGVKHPLFSLSQLLLQGFLKGIGGLGPRPENEPSREEMTTSEKAVAANVRYLEEVGYFSRDEGDVLDVDVFGRSKR